MLKAKPFVWIPSFITGLQTGSGQTLLFCTRVTIIIVIQRLAIIIVISVPIRVAIIVVLP